MRRHIHVPRQPARARKISVTAAPPSDALPFANATFTPFEDEGDDHAFAEFNGRIQQLIASGTQALHAAPDMDADCMGDEALPDDVASSW